MIRKIMGGFLLLGALAPFTLSAATIEELQEQVNALLVQITQLQQQMQSVQKAGTNDAVLCIDLNRNVSRGMSGEDVTRLQNFLKQTGDFAGESTGFFGSLTEGAVQKWQVRNGVISAGTPATGFGSVGPRTRSAMACRLNAGTSGIAPPSRAPLPAAPPTRRFCLQGTAVVAHAASIQLYVREKARTGETCAALAQSRTCTDGSLDGDSAYTHLTCAESNAQNCSIGGTIILNGSSVTLYSYASVLQGDSCSNYATQRTCTNGVLSGDAAYVHAQCITQQLSTNDSFLDLFYPTQSSTQSAGGASCKSAGGDRVSGVTLSEQLITGGSAANSSILPWYVCNNGTWQCTAFCAVGDQRLWQEGGVWKSNTAIVSQVGIASTTMTSGAALPDVSASANQNACLYKGVRYPMGMRTEGTDLNNLCLGADLSACLVETTILPQFECRNGSWQRAAAGGSGQGLPTPTTYLGNCTPGDPWCHFCVSGTYGFWTTDLLCPDSSI